jgi:hypothetical protein
MMHRELVEDLTITTDDVYHVNFPEVPSSLAVTLYQPFKPRPWWKRLWSDRPDVMMQIVIAEGRAMFLQGGEGIPGSGFTSGTRITLERVHPQEGDRE